MTSRLTVTPVGKFNIFRTSMVIMLCVSIVFFIILLTVYLLAEGVDNPQTCENLCCYYERVEMYERYKWYYLRGAEFSVYVYRQKYGDIFTLANPKLNTTTVYVYNT